MGSIRPGAGRQFFFDAGFVLQFIPGNSERSFKTFVDVNRSYRYQSYLQNMAIAFYITHGMEGIGAEVHDHLIDLGGIGKNRRAFLVNNAFYLDRGRYRWAQEFEDLFNNILDFY